MKKYIYILLLSVLSLEACYEDKGNYDYDPIASIEMSGIETEYTKYCVIDSLHIIPQFRNKENYDFLWTMFSNSIVQAPVDTISYEPELHRQVVENSDNYTIVLTVTDRTTGDQQMFTTRYSVLTQFSKGCYILKEIDGEADVDLLTPEQTLVADILKARSHRLAGKPMGLTVCGDINYVDDDGKKQDRVKTFWVCSDQDAQMLRLDDMTPVYDIHTMFFEERANESPRNIFTMGNTNLVYLSNNGCYNIALMVQTAMHKFGYPIVIQKNLTTDSDNCSCSTYGIEKSVYYMFYDEENCRFLRYCNGKIAPFLDLNTQWMQVQFPYSSNNMNCDLIYMGASATNGYALMRQRESNQYLMYKLETALYDSYATNYLFSPLLSVQYLSASHKIISGETFGSNLTDAYTYFSIGNQLNLFDFTENPGREELNILPGLEGTISLIKHIKTEDNKNYLVVATEQSGRYKIYFCEMIAGKPDPAKNPIVFEGMGRPKDICIL